MTLVLECNPAIDAPLLLYRISAKLQIIVCSWREPLGETVTGANWVGNPRELFIRTILVAHN